MDDFALISRAKIVRMMENQLNVQASMNEESRLPAWYSHLQWVAPWQHGAQSDMTDVTLNEKEDFEDFTPRC